MRNVLVHYHLFKNAGSSIDRCLKESFGEAWHAFDPEHASGLYTSEELSEIIERHPNTVAFSSHCIIPPLSCSSAQISPIIILREPISRVMSAYLFEWKKQKGLEVACGSLADYIQKKFEQPRMNAIENFQTIRLSVNDRSRRRPAESSTDEDLLRNACSLIEQLPAFGLVEHFSESVDWLQRTYSAIFPLLDLKPVTANITQDSGRSMAARHAAIRDEIGVDLFNTLLLRNQLDIRLYEFALGRFKTLSGCDAIAGDAGRASFA